MQLAAEEGIIDTGSVLDMLMAGRREKVKKIHPYALTPPKTPGGRWQTCYKDEKGNRKNIKAQTEEGLLDKLIPVYFSGTHIDKLTFHGLYEEWLEYKKSCTESPNTILRHRQHYKKYLQPSRLHGMGIRRIDGLTLEQECNRIVKEFRMSRKEWTNLKTVLNGMFTYAFKKHYLKENPMGEVTVTVKFRQVRKKTGQTETFNTEELEQLTKYLDGMYAETGDTAFLAVKLNFLLGLRVGELVALRWEDWCDSSHLHIVREEVRDQEKSTYHVEEHTKTYSDRFVVLVPKAKKILQQIERQGEYIFMRGGERLTSRQVAYVLEKYAQRQGVPTKSTHKMRKTYASRLSSSGVPLDSIRELLGHSSLSTTLGYIYNPLTEAETVNLIENAL